MNRTIENLRNAIGGRIYIYLANEKIGKQFLQDAENEGYKFGKIKPTDNTWSNIIALEHKKHLSYVGFVGHMNFQCNGGSNGNLTRIDYEKYIRGDKNFIFEDKNPVQETVIKGKFFGDITIVGDECFDAAVLLGEELQKCSNEDAEEALYNEIESKYDVIILPEN